MKSVTELVELRDRLVSERETDDKPIKVLVGLATCGIAAGARPIKDAFAEEVKNNEINNVEIKQTGCIGICQFEPVVEIYEQGKEKVTYVHMSEDRVPRIVKEHLQGGNPVVEYTIGAVEL